MKMIMTAVVTVAIGCFSCSRSQPLAFPACMQMKIDSLKAKPKQNPPASVTAYLYRNKTVYLVSADCCDQYDALYDMQCHYLGAPGGGITGRGDGTLTDFAKMATLIRVIWKDDR